MAIPKKGTLERILFDKIEENGGEGVTCYDLRGTGIDESNIDEVIENIKSGKFEPEDDGALGADGGCFAAAMESVRRSGGFPVKKMGSCDNWKGRGDHG